MNDSEKEVEVIDPKLIKAVEKVTLDLIKRDYRATVIQRTETAPIDDSEAALINIDYSKEDIFGNPVELDEKGTIDRYDSWLFKEMRYGKALTMLKDWRYIELKEQDREGKTIIRQIPIDLAQVIMHSKQMLNLSLHGNQSEKHIRERRANSGRDPDSDPLSKLYGAFNVQRADKKTIQGQYEQK